MKISNVIEKEIPVKLLEFFENYISGNEIPKEFQETGITKQKYLDVMEQCLDAYTKSELETMTTTDIQTYSRILSVMGGLLANGRKQEYKSLWEKMMGRACAAIHTRVKDSQVDFAVKELMLAYKAMKNIVTGEKRKQWHEDLSLIDPYTNYAYTNCNMGASSLHNINIYNMAGEYLRETEQMTDIGAYFNSHWPIQFSKFDRYGLYIDPAALMLYDITTRVQMQLIPGYGYSGTQFNELDGKLKSAGPFTIFMQSAAFQLPYGGRSNQYLFNETLIAANCEYEAARYKQLGNPKMAGAMKRSARLAVRSIDRWLTARKHIKNLYADETIGTEGYGYYDKYMITLGSFLYIGYLFAEDDIQEFPCPAETGGYVFQTDDEFHKIFANSNEYSIEIDTNADFHYDSTGLGRIHKRGFPTELALSMPITATPGYTLMPGVTKKNLSICPGWDNGKGGIQFLSELSGDLSNNVRIRQANEEKVEFCTEYTGAAFAGCGGIRENYAIDREGVHIRVELLNPTGNKIYFQVPLFITNGRDVSEIISNTNQAVVKLQQYYYQVDTDGQLEIRAGKYGNRNGEYEQAIISRDGNTLQVDLKLYQ